MKGNLNTAKLFYITCVFVLCTLFYFSWQIPKEENLPMQWNDHRYNYNSSTKYILQWTPGDISPFDMLGEKSDVFVRSNCSFSNCFITDDRNFFPYYTIFDAVIFNGKHGIGVPLEELPKYRSSEQKYILATTESAHYYSICDDYYDNFFNWTFTYRLDSDVRWGYITVFHKNGTIAGPKINMDWIKHMDSIDDGLKEALKSKTKVAAIFVSNCRSRGKREIFLSRLQRELSSKYNLHVDIYGSCGSLKCPKRKFQECFKKIEQFYYFYLAFENSLAIDYVSEKLLNGLNHLAVPVVYGGADYSRQVF